MALPLVMLLAINITYGQGKNEEVTIIAPYIPSIQNASKVPFRPEVQPSVKAHEPFEYQYLTRQMEVTTELDPLEPMKFSEERKEDIYRNFIKAGFGNYLTPYLEFIATSGESEKYLAGARLRHHSSQGKIRDYADNSYSHNLFAANASAFLKPGTISGEIGYNRDMVHYYGFPIDSFPDLNLSGEDLRQRYQHFWLSVDFQGQNKSREKLKYNIGSDFHFYNDRFETREVQFDLNGGIDKVFSTDEDFRHALGVDLGLKYLGYKDTLVSNSPLIFDLSPIYRFGLDIYSFEVGLNVFFITENSELQSDSRLDVFPHLKAEVILIEDQLKAFAQVSGKKEINTYRGLTGINPYLGSTPLILNTDQPINITGGITGSAGGFNFNADASYSYNKDVPLFVNDTSLELQNKFQLIYDDVNLLNIKASVSYLKIRHLDARLFASFNKYIPEDEKKAWHLPSYEAGLNVRYLIKERYTVTGDFLILGHRYARTFDKNEVVATKLGTAFDLNLGFDYRITEQLSAFVTVNNILNQNYQRWHQYPVQGIQAMLGVQFSF